MKEQNPYLDTVKEYGAETLRNSMAQAVDKQPENEALVQTLAKQYNLPVEAVRLEKPAIERRAKLDGMDYKSIVENYKATALFLTDPNNAALAHDDTETLTALEALYGSWQAARRPKPSFSSTITGLASSIGTGAELTRQGIRQQAADALGFEDVSKDAQRKAGQARFRQELADPEFESSTAQGLYGGGRSLLQMVPGIAGAIITRSPSIAIGAAGVQTETEAYTRYRARGATPGEAITGAAGEGAVEVVTELLPMSFLVNRFGKEGAGKFLTEYFVKEGLTEQAATLAQDAIDTAIANPDKTWGDYVKERPDAAYQTALGTLVASGTLGAANAAARRLSGESERVAAAQHDAEVLTKMVEIARASPTAERSPAALKQFTDIVASSGVKDLYVNAQALAQSGIDVIGLAGISPSVEEQLQQALDTGGDIKIPLSEFVADIAPSDLGQPLVDHLKTSPEGMSGVEAQEFTKNQAAELQAQTEKVLAEKIDDEAFKASSRTVHEEILRQLNEANRFSPDVNESYATLHSNFATVYGAKLGVTPEEFYKQYYPRESLFVQAQGQTGDTQTLDLKQDPRADFQERVIAAQDLRDAAREQGYRVTPNSDGSVTLYHGTSAANAESINTAGQLNEGAFFSFRKADTDYYAKQKNKGGQTIEFRVDPRDIEYSTGTGEVYAPKGLVRGEDGVWRSPSRDTQTLDLEQATGRLPQGYISQLGFDDKGPRFTDKGKGQISVTAPDGTEAGIVRFVKNNDDSIFISSQWTEVAHRRKGIAAAMVNEVMDRFSTERVYTSRLTGEGEAFLGSQFDLRQLTPDEARRYQLTQREGSSLEGVYDKNAAYYEITRKAQLDQSPIKTDTPEFKNWFGDSKVVDAEGRPLVVYHGTDKKFQAFDPKKGAQPIIWFTSNKADIENGEVGAAGKGRIIGMYASLKNPAGWEEYDRYGLDELMARGYDGAILPEKDGSFTGFAFEPTQLKSTANRGAFDPNDKRLMYQGDLLIQHNLTERNLLHAKKLGGIPVPSLAVTKKDAPLTNFGEITLLGSKDMADPKGYASTKVFGADVYSPRYPTVEYQVSQKEVDRLDKELAPYSKKYGGGELYSGSALREGPRELERNTAVMARFLEEKGVVVEPVRDENGRPDRSENRYALERQVRELKLGDELAAYAERLFETLGAKEKIFQGFTNSGNRKYIEHNLENVVRLLKKELRGGEGFNYGVGSLRAKFTPQFKSIEQIRKAKNRLVDDASFKKVKEEIDKEFFTVADALKPHYNHDATSFRYYEEVINVLGDAAKQGLPRALNEYGFKEVPPELLRSAAEFLNKLRELPTEYFEAKILRDVSLSEFSGAVVPEGTSEEALQYLRDRGVTDIKTYERGDETDRAAKIAEFENLFFQDNSNKRGSFNPSTGTITLLAKADLSTFLHESGHFFLETINKIATNPNAPAEIAGDMDAVLKWFGIQGESPEARLTEWNSHDLEWQRDYHERFARGFEAYLFEGRAPSLAIQQVFHRFRAWLMKVYRSLLDLNVELNEDVRGVFDRMLASSEQIKEAEAARNFEPMFKTPEEAGMTPEEFKEYIDTGLGASLDAAHELEKRSLRDMKWLSNAKGKALKKLQAEADAKRKAVRQEITEQVMSEPVYRAREFLKRGVLDGEKVEGAHKLYIPEVEAMLEGNPALGAIKEKLGYGKYGMLGTEQGVHPDQVAEMFGLESGDQLIRELVAAEDPKAKIDALTDKTMLERYGDLTDEDAVERAAERAIHNEARLRFVATEMAALLKQMGSVQELQRLAKGAAESAIGQVKVKELNPNRYIAAGVRASRAAEKAIKSGDRNEAIRQKRLQLFHVAMTKAAMDARADSEKALLKFRKLFRKDKVLAKKHDMKLVTAARAVLGAYGIGGKVNAVQALSDLEKVKEYDPEMYAQIEPVMRSALQGAGDYASLPYADFKAMLDAVNQIVHSAKRSKQVRIDGQLVDKKQVVTELRARMEEIGIPAAKPGDTSAVSDADRRKWTLQGLVSAARRVEAWVDSMDGGKFDGPFRKYIFQPISNAVTRYRTEKNRVLREYVALLREKQAEFNQAKVAAPEINYTFANKNELLGALLHIGNMSNKRKLLLGRGWATETVTPAGEKVLNTGRMDAFLDRMIKEGTLTKSDFDFLQKVWDLMESIKGDAQKAHYDMYGHYFNEITADPVVTPFGTYRGGYAPAVADKEIVQDATMKAEANAIEEGFNYMMPSTATGFTKGRVEYNKPLVMDLRLVASHIDQALRFTYVQPAVRDALRIIRSSSFAGPMQKMDPTAITEMLMPWLHRSARQLATSPWTGWGGKAADKFLKGLRKRTGMVAMTANLVNAFQQITGFTMAAVKVNPRHLKSSLFRYMKAPNDTAEAIAASSPWMAERLSAESFELRRAMDEMLEDETAWQKTKEIANRHAYFAQRAFQNVVDIVSWQAAFDQASATMTEKEAVQFADSVVRQTQGTQSPEDIARFEASNSFVQLFTQFTGYFNMQANLLGTEYKKTMRDMGGDKGRLAYVYTMGFMLPAVIADGIVRTFGWDWDDEDDDGYLDEMISWLFGSQLRTGVAMFPFVGSVANAGVNAMNKQPFDDRLSTSPSVSTIESSVRAPVSVYKALAGEGRASKAIGDVLTLITMTTGIPVTAASRPLKYAADAAQDKVEPANAADLVRGAVSGKGREEERKK